MPFKIRNGISTSISVPLVFGTGDENGEYATVEQGYLPGAMLPPNVHPALIQKFRDGDEHTVSFLEEVDANPQDISVKIADLPQQTPFDIPGAPFTDYPATSQAQVLADQVAAGGAVTEEGQKPAPVLTSNPFAAAANAAIPEGAGDDYGNWQVPELEAEATKRGLTVTGSGSNGGIIKADLIKALTDDDAK